MRTVMVWWTVGMIGLALMAGCKDGVPETELDKFVARTAKLDGQALMDTLRHIAAGGPPHSGYANYLIGNRFYGAAGDSAASGGWDRPGVGALLDSAQVYFELAAAQDSAFIEPVVNLGSVWDDRSEMQGNRNDRNARIATAERYYRQALDIDPNDEKARCNLGSLYLRQRRTQQALDEFQAVLEFNPKSALAHYNLAIMFAESKIYREAIEEWKLAVKYDKGGDIGQRSSENIKIVEELLNTPDPKLDP